MPEEEFTKFLTLGREHKKNGMGYPDDWMEWSFEQRMAYSQGRFLEAIDCSDKWLDSIARSKTGK